MSSEGREPDPGAGGDSWARLWASSAPSAEALRRALAEEEGSSRFRRVLGRIGAAGLHLKGLKTVELGAGRGTVSLLLASRGADVTLVDSSAEAVVAAKKLFSLFGLRATFETEDMLSLPDSLRGAFEVAMSFGVAEHFTGPRRAGVFSAHAAALRPGGLAFVSVPNSRCLPYRFWKFAKETLGTWEYGAEVPFSPGELRDSFSGAGFEGVEVFGSGLLFAIDRFASLGLISRLGADANKETCLDDRFGYALTASGSKGRAPGKAEK